MQENGESRENCVCENEICIILKIAGEFSNVHCIRYQCNVV